MNEYWRTMGLSEKRSLVPRFQAHSAETVQEELNPRMESPSHWLTLSNKITKGFQAYMEPRSRVK